MRLILLLFIVFASVIHLYGGELTSNIDEAKKLSLEHNKPILIDFMTDW